MKQIKRPIVIGIVFAILFTAIVSLGVHTARLSARETFSSEDEMKSALVGTWENDLWSLIIKKDTATLILHRISGDDASLEPESYSCSPSNGTFKFWGDTYALQKGGNEIICSDGHTYTRVGGSSSSSASSSVDMRTRLTNASFQFYLNSAGGIEFDFTAYNSSNKTIKYVRFNADLLNAVGDTAYDEITRKSYAPVEIIGPVAPGAKVSMKDEIIGYCDTLARIDIGDITIVYDDNSSETGSFNYYFEK